MADDATDALKAQLADRDHQLLTLRLELVDAKITTLKEHDEDKELRIRQLETSRIRFETLVWLACGGGAISVLKLISDFFPGIPH